MNNAIREASRRYGEALFGGNVLQGHQYETNADIDLHQLALDLVYMVEGIAAAPAGIVNHMELYGGMPENTRKANIVRRESEAFKAALVGAADRLRAIAKAMPTGDDRVRAERAAELAAEDGVR